MPRIFSRRFAVPPDAIDANQHVNNIAYVRWMQDIAIEHSTAQGWGMERYLASGASWVVRSHFVEYLRPAFAEDTLEAYTWVAAMEGRRSPRKYLFLNSATRKILARAETVWAYVDLRTGRPIPIPAELGAAFEVVPDEREVLEHAGVKREG